LGWINLVVYRFAMQNLIVFGETFEHENKKFSKNLSLDGIARQSS